MSDRATIYLVRHAKAGERGRWAGPDEERPLSRTGWKQARAIAERLDGKASPSLISSPYVRCVETLEPLAELLDADVDVDERLAEHGDFEPLLDLIDQAPDGTVLCSHGDMIPAAIEALHRRGMELLNGPDWRKATIWVLRRKGRRITKGKVWRPTTE